MTPVLALVIEPLVEHFHDFHKVASGTTLKDDLRSKLDYALVVGQLGDFVHLSPGRTPGVI